MKHDVLGLINFHNAPAIKYVTDGRPLGSTSFLGRYALVDFALSNFANSGITDVCLLVKDHVRSVTKHLGARNTWATNTKQSRMFTMWNEKAINNPIVNTDINNILENDWILFDSNASYIVIMPTHVICNIDLKPYIEEHAKGDAKISVIVKEIKDPSKEFLSQRIVTLNDDGTVKSSSLNKGKQKEPAMMSTGIYIINRDMLASTIRDILPLHPTFTFEEMIAFLNKNNIEKVHYMVYDGYMACIDSYEAYMRTCFDMLNEKSFAALFENGRKVYTLPHETPPAEYGVHAKVKNSIVSNGAIIEGTIINSIISRNVRIEKGAVVKDSVIFSSCKIEEGAKVSNVLMDKYSNVAKKHEVSGTMEDPLYIGQGSKI